TAQVGSLQMTGGSVRDGTLILGGNVVATSAPPLPAFPNDPPTPAAISANLQLGDATRNFIVTRGPAATDLIVGGAITSTTPGVGLTKQGTGILRLAGSSANGYTGTTTVQAGTLYLQKF